MHRQRRGNNFLVDRIGDQCFGMLRGMVMENNHTGAFVARHLHKKVVIESMWRGWGIRAPESAVVSSVSLYPYRQRFGNNFLVKTIGNVCFGMPR